MPRFFPGNSEYSTQMSGMQRLSSEAYQTLTEGAEVIEKDHFGYKVLKLKDETFLKLFRVKSTISSAWLRPYSVRFARNASELIARGVQTVDIIGCYRLERYKNTAVHYRPLPGQTLRQVFPVLDEEETRSLAEQVAEYIADLHERGVYFRSLHMGNILKLPDGTLGLIDIADMRFSQRPLKEELRLRNLHHLARYERDVRYLIKDQTFCATYAKLADVAVDKVAAVMHRS
ncbi:lipopolysaccharide kinase InaA family protein [Endozoicomonas arenosclerae]|uniref:lipopolysaccharide kinase InaA family protein n=1 Tax=Endozoicomonas arenosclerae TaxID=1633495 RepID=UPI0007822069|nr:lipopolysaccharide kinase InaA family protein [Endozoicomonas arenosclerae]